MNLGLFLKELRLKHSKTQEEMGSLLGLKRPAYQAIENNRNGVDLEMLQKVSKAFPDDISRIIHQVFPGYTMHPYVDNKEDSDPNLKALKLAENSHDYQLSNLYLRKYVETLEENKRLSLKLLNSITEDAHQQILEGLNTRILALQEFVVEHFAPLTKVSIARLRAALSTAEAKIVKEGKHKVYTLSDESSPGT